METAAIAQNVRKLREARHWTQEELAAASGVDVRTIQRAEHGEPLRTETLKALAASFNTTIEALSFSEEQARLALEDFRAKFALISMRPVESGSDLAGLLGTDAYNVQRIGRFSEEQADEIAALEELVCDYGDLWSGFGPMEKREAEKTIGDVVVRVRSLGLSVSAGRRDVRLKTRTRKDSFRITFLYVAVVIGSTPLLYLADEKGKPVSFA